MFKPSFYRKAGWMTCFSILLLVLAGGIVRTTGSGMGCPDWPTCFGTYIPPTNVNQLPDNYKDLYLKKRLSKIDKYVKVLNSFGFKKQANAIAENGEIRQAEEFSVLSTWIESVNRYLGALTGIFALITFISSFQFIKTKKPIFILTFLGLIGILINAWLGSVVVATNLMQGPITLHYLAAFLTLALFMWPILKLNLKKITAPRNGKIIILVGFLLVVLQSITGTWSRETVDVISNKGVLVNADGHLNYSAMGLLFIIHRYLAVPVLLLTIYLFKKTDKSYFKKFYQLGIVIIACQIIAGSINILWVLPPFSQAFHIFAGGIIFALWLFYFIHFYIKKYNDN